MILGISKLVCVGVSSFLSIKLLLVSLEGWMEGTFQVSKLNNQY